MINLSDDFINSLIRPLKNDDYDKAIELWQQILLDNDTVCKDCAYDKMIGRKCCCMCMESNLAVSALNHHQLPKQVEDLSQLIKGLSQYRLEKCDHCKTNCRT